MIALSLPLFHLSQKTCWRTQFHQMIPLKSLQNKKSKNSVFHTSLSSSLCGWWYEGYPLPGLSSMIRKLAEVRPSLWWTPTEPLWHLRVAHYEQWSVFRHGDDVNNGTIFEVLRNWCLSGALLDCQQYKVFSSAHAYAKLCIYIYIFSRGVQTIWAVNALHTQEFKRINLWTG